MLQGSVGCSLALVVVSNVKMLMLLRRSQAVANWKADAVFD